MSWMLEVDGDPKELSTMVRIADARGQFISGGGAMGSALGPGGQMDEVWHLPSAGLRAWIGRVGGSVGAVVAHLSDGTREDIRLYGDVAEFGARVGVLVYPRELDIHRIDLYDRRFALIPRRP